MKYLDNGSKQLMTRPSVTLNNYGKLVDIMAQTKLTLSLGKQLVASVVLIQKGAPNDLLVGTDILPQLGVSLVVDKGNGYMMDLLIGWETHQVMESEKQEDRPRVLVLIPSSLTQCLQISEVWSVQLHLSVVFQVKQKEVQSLLE